MSDCRVTKLVLVNGGIATGGGADACIFQDGPAKYAGMALKTPQASPSHIPAYNASTIEHRT
jgi:hypothetical protein